jgi:cell division protein FtsI/penicillin-binding protein 2
MAGATGAAPRPLAGAPGPADAADDPRWSVPPSLDALLQPLDGLRQPAGTLYRLYADVGADGERHGPNRVALDGADVDVGFSVRLTIDPALQALAQKTAACYTGRQDVCRALGVRRAEDGDRPVGHRLLERAAVRMAAVAVVDVASGRIEALAGALSPCARQSFDGPGLGTGCDRRLPYPVQYRPDALLNPAVFTDAMPASTIKPILAAAFLSDPQAGARWLAAERTAMAKSAAPSRDSLRGQLMRSDSARFLDRLFCVDAQGADCRRPWAAQAMASAFGWNAGCDRASVDCGRHDLLFGRTIDAGADEASMRPLSMPVAYGRLMSEPPRGLGPAMHLMPAAPFDPAVVRRCAAGADGARRTDDDWEKCRGRGVVNMAAEGWGQGHARATAVGVAGMMAALAAAANGQAAQRRPHLVDDVRDARNEPLALAVQRRDLAPPLPVRVSRDAAEVILSGLSYGHRAGTSRTACEQVFDARRCRDIDWLAGKTGTPSFPSDGVPLDALARQCRRTAPQGVKAPACSSLRPHKWYVAAYRTDPAGRGPWTKAIAVLTERNWVQSSGQVHGAGDHGPNPAAEIAMQIAGRHVGRLGSAP